MVGGVEYSDLRDIELSKAVLFPHRCIRIWRARYFWDYTNSAAAEYFIQSVVVSLDDPAVDG